MADDFSLNPQDRRQMSKLEAALSALNVNRIEKAAERGKKVRESPEAERKTRRKAAAETAPAGREEPEVTRRRREGELTRHLEERDRAGRGRATSEDATLGKLREQEQSLSRQAEIQRQMNRSREAFLPQGAPGQRPSRATSGPALRGWARESFQPLPYDSRHAEVRRRLNEGPGAYLGGGRPPREPPTAAVGGGPGAVAARQKLADSQKGVGTASAQAAGGVKALNNELVRNIQTHGAAAQGMRSHGALTTEFFSALRRGETTLSEVRFQTAATTAKFAGWTLAATAVYGFVGALSAVGKGAIDANTQVANIKRYLGNLDTSKARNELVALSEEFNLPIEDVGTAYQRMAQVFHSQEGAFEGTRVALQAVKIGELSAADATRYLTAIVQGASLPASELQTVFDQINFAQNKYGTSIRDTIAGTAKAAGAWTAAGGSLRGLVALIATSKRFSGRTGEEIGTALQRSAESIYRRPKNQKQLRGFGIDPKQDINEIYKDAIEKVKSGKVKGKDINKLATALSTPQLSSRIAPILQHPQDYEKLFGQIGHKKEIGDVRSKELKQTLSSAEELIKRVGTELGALGAQLGASGALTGIGLMIKGLNLSLHAATEMLRLFNELPKPLRVVGSLLIQAAIAGRVLSRLGVGPSALGLLGPGRVQARAHAREPVEFARKEVTAAEAGVIGAQYNRARAAHAGDEVAVTASENELQAANQRLTFARLAAAQAETEYAAVVQRTAIGGVIGGGSAVRNAEKDAQKARGVLTREQAAAVAAGAAGGGVTKGGVHLPRGGEGVAKEEAGLAGAATAAGKKSALSFAARATAFLTNPFVLIGGLLTTVLVEAAREKAKEASEDIRRLARGPRTTDQSNAILKRKPVKPIDPKILAGIQGIPVLGPGVAEGLKLYDSGVRKVDQNNAAINAAKARERFRQQQERDARAGVHGRQGLFGNLLDANADTGQVGGRYKGKPFAARGQLPDRISRDAKQAVASYRIRRHSLGEAQRELDRLEEEARHADYQGKDPRGQRERKMAEIRQLREKLGPGQGLGLKDILGNLSLDKFTERLSGDADAISTYYSAFGGFGAKGAGVSALRDLQTGYRLAQDNARKNPTIKNLKKFAAARQDIDTVLQGIGKELDDDLKLAEGDPGATQAALQRAAAAGKKVSPDRRKTALFLRELAEKGIQAATKELDDDLKLARDPAAREAAFRKAAGAINRVPHATGRQRALAQRERLDKQFSTFKEDLDASTQLAQARTPDAGRDAQIAINSARAELAQARKLGQDKKTIQAALAKLFEAYRQAAEARVSLVESQGAIAIARQTQPVGRARAQLQADANVLRAMRQSGQYSTAELNNQIAKVIGDQVALADAIHDQAKGLADSVIELRASRTDDPIKLAHYEYEKALNDLRFARTPEEKNRAQANVNKTRREYRQTKQNEAYDELQFEYDIGKIDREALLSRLRTFLKTIKGNRELRRRIRRQIHDLEKEQEGDRDNFELNVADIRLPTVYDVRRGLGAPRRGGSAISYHNAPTINVTVNDPAAAGDVYSAIDRSSGTGVRQAARAAGVL